MSPKRKRTIAVDFDGVIHRYSKGWHDGSIYDDPVEGARKALARIHRRYDIVIFTTRVSPEMHASGEQMEMLRGWLENHGFRQGEHYDRITHIKPPALVYIVDRALHFTAWDSALEELGQRYRLD